MASDCGFEKEEFWFRYRTGAIIVKDRKMLFVQCMYGGYYYMIGGGVHLGEMSEECIEREVFEETGLRLKAERPAIICENFFPGKGGLIDGKNCHELEFYYRMQDPADFDVQQMTDANEKLVWLPMDKFDEYDIRPSILKSKLREAIDGAPLMHIVSQE